MPDLPDEIWARVALAAGACATVSRLRTSLARRRLCRHRLPHALCRWLGVDPAHLAQSDTRALAALELCGMSFMCFLGELLACVEKMVYGPFSDTAPYLLPTAWHGRHYAWAAVSDLQFSLRVRRSQTYRLLNLYSPPALKEKERCHVVYRLTRYEISWARRHCPTALALIY